jgi:hypothetical protein
MSRSCIWSGWFGYPGGEHVFEGFQALFAVLLDEFGELLAAWGEGARGLIVVVVTIVVVGCGAEDCLDMRIGQRYTTGYTTVQGFRWTRYHQVANNINPLFLQYKFFSIPPMNLPYP